MKRLLLLFILLIVTVVVSADEINCADHPYACVECTYEIGGGGKKVTFKVFSDGTITNMTDMKLNWTPGENYAPRITTNVFTRNFELDDENKLKCPEMLYFTARQEGYSGVYFATFDKDAIENYHESSLINEVNNNKLIYEQSNDVISCTYTNNVTMKSDGKTLIIENMSDKVILYGDGIHGQGQRIEKNTSKKIEGENIGNFSATDFIKNDNELYCPNYYLNCSAGYCSISKEKIPTSEEIESSETLDGKTILNARDLVEGRTYIYLLGSLKTPLVIGNKNFNNLNLIINDVESTLDDVKANNSLCSGNDCLDNNEYYIEQGLSNIVVYCNNFYSNYEDYRKNEPDKYKKRMEECISFQNFYQEGVKNNVFIDYSNSCGILSKDIRDKLEWVLDIIKIAGPILAVGLGTLDFVKVVASGDADKEMKSAFKRFGTRIIAAVLLFLVPVILAFLMDTFLGNQSGYDSDNPFCDIVDWSE